MEPGPQFAGIRHGDFHYHLEDHAAGQGLHAVTAHARKEGFPKSYPVGRLYFANHPHSPDPGVVADVYVDPEHERRGLASAMYARAKQINPAVHHNREQSAAGKAWAKKVGR